MPAREPAEQQHVPAEAREGERRVEELQRRLAPDHLLTPNAHLQRLVDDRHRDVASNVQIQQLQTQADLLQRP